MDKYNVQQKINIIEWFFSSDSVKETQKLFAAKFNVTPTDEAIRDVVHYFEKHGCVTTSDDMCGDTKEDAGGAEVPPKDKKK